MKTLAPDEVNFAEYEWQTDCKAKVRSAVDFAEAMAMELEPAQRDTAPTVFSFKLGRVMRFRPGEVTAWAGYSGHRKSMVTGQVALELAIQRQRTLVISLEMAPAKTLARMAKQFWGEGARDFGRFHDRTGDLYLFDHQGRISPAQCIAVCNYFAQELQGTQVFIDSFMMVCGSEESMDEQKQMTTDLVRMAQDTGLHVHLIAHCRKPSSDTGESRPPGKHDLRGSAAITDQCANVITVWANKPKEEKLHSGQLDTLSEMEPDAQLTVCKHRNGEFEGRLKLWLHRQSLRFIDDQRADVGGW